MGTSQRPALDMDKLNAFVAQFVGDLGAAVHAGMVIIGEKLGLYKGLAAGPMTSAELAAVVYNGLVNSGDQTRRAHLDCGPPGCAMAGMKP